LNKLGKVAEILSADPKQASRADGAQQSTPLHLAARRGLVEIAKLLLQKGAELNEQDKTLKSALHWACSTKNSEMVRFLLEQPGIEVFAVDSKKRLPLHLAVVLAPKETVEALVQADDTGSHLNDKDSQGCTPLHVSIRYDNEAAETLLLQRKGSFG
jgi:ankyrin repeat protein